MYLQKVLKKSGKFFKIFWKIVNFLAKNSLFHLNQQPPTQVDVRSVTSVCKLYNKNHCVSLFLKILFTKLVLKHTQHLLLYSSDTSQPKKKQFSSSKTFQK